MAALKTPTNLVGNILDTEFGWYPEIAHTRRLGRVMVERIQPLAVTFVDATVAPYLVQYAKLLRQSVNISVRQKVFINSDMTRAESPAAYELRLQRRKRQRNQQTTTHKSRVVQPTNRPSSTIRSFVDDRVHHYAAQHNYYDNAYPAVPQQLAHRQRRRGYGY